MPKGLIFFVIVKYLLVWMWSGRNKVKYPQGSCLIKRSVSYIYIYRPFWLAIVFQGQFVMLGFLLLEILVHTDSFYQDHFIGNKTVRHPLKKTVRHQDISAPVEKDSSAPRHFGTVEKKCQIGTAFSFKQTWLPFLK